MLNKFKSEILRYDTFLRLIEVEDYRFLYEIRNDSVRNQYVSSINEDIVAQKVWLENYKLRELKGEEFYFVVGTENKQLFGTTRLYDFKNGSFTIGSWVFKESSPEGLAILGDIIAREIGFDVLGFDRCQFEVRKNNKKVLNYHKLWKPKLIFEDDLNYYFELTKKEFNLSKLKFLKLLGHGD